MARKTKDDLVVALGKSLYDLNSSVKNKGKVIKALSERGYSVGAVYDMLDGNENLGTLSFIDLGVLADVIYRNINDSRVRPNIFFSDVELKNISTYKESPSIHKQESVYPIKFSNMTQLSNDTWLGVIPITSFVDLLKNRTLRYNYETQRNPKYYKYKDKLIQRPNINISSVREISDAIISGNYIYDVVTFNILNEANEKGVYPEFDYNSSSRELTLIAGSIDLIDGMHRGKGAEMALLNNPNTEENFGLMITNFSVDKANSYILQTDKRNPLDVEFKKSLDIENYSTATVKLINQNTQSDLKGLIVTDDVLINEGFGLYLVSNFSYILSYLWDIKTRGQSNQLANYLIDFFNEIINHFPDEMLLDIKSSKKLNYINHRNMLVYYLTLAKDLQGNDNWRNILNNILSNTDFSFKNPVWEHTIKNVYKTNSSRELIQTTRIMREYQNKINSEVK